jgi:hypothetical protein
MSYNYVKYYISKKIEEYRPLIAENSLIPMIFDPRYKLDIIDTKN